MKRKASLKPQAVACPYCDKPAEYVNSREIYGKSYGMAYLCKPCDAYVGVHKGTTRPLGRLANKELRQWKIRAHDAFDPVWHGSKMSRTQAYTWLAEQLGIAVEHCHIGMFNVERCKEVVAICDQFRRNAALAAEGVGR